MPVDIILYAIIAAGLVFWLNNILGTKNGEEKNHRPSSSNGSQDAPLTPHDKKTNVIGLNTNVGDVFVLPHHVKIENKTAENNLLDIAESHENFDLNHFASGVSDAFSIVVESFADGDKETLNTLLADAVYDAFVKEIDARTERGETVTTEIQAVRKVDIIEAYLKEKIIYLTVRFTAQEICVIRDSEEKIISGNPDKVTEMVDVWVFGRDTTAEGPEWLVYETRDDEQEDHKTPLPESKD